MAMTNKQKIATTAVTMVAVLAAVTLGMLLWSPMPAAKQELSSEISFILRSLGEIREDVKWIKEKLTKDQEEKNPLP